MRNIKLIRNVTLAAIFLTLMGCATSQWKIHGGPKECIQMCKKWDLEFSGMVGVGNQDKSGDGATACVCQLAKKETALLGKEAATTGSLAAPITAAQAAAAAQLAMQRQQQQMANQARY